MNNSTSPLVTVARALVISRLQHRSAEAWLAEHAAGDIRAEMILRAVQSPASIADPEWAGTLLVPTLLDFVSALPASAAGQLLNMAAVRVSGDVIGPVTVPYRKSSTGWAWVSEGAAISVGELDFAGAPLPASKLAFMCVYTEEIANASTIQNTLEQVLREDAATALDAAMLSDAAASGGAPAGLFAGATAVPGTANALPDIKAMVEAIPNPASLAWLMHQSQLLGAQAAGLVAADGTIARAPVLLSGAMLGNVALVDVADLAVRVSTGLELDATNSAVVHMDDAAAPISDDAGTLAAPSLSMWQQACIALRAVLPMAWTMRGQGRVAYLTGATW